MKLIIPPMAEPIRRTNKSDGEIGINPVRFTVRAAETKQFNDMGSLSLAHHPFDAPLHLLQRQTPLVPTAAQLIAEFKEIETGTRKRHRPELDAALVACRAQGAVLVIAKFDRLARDVAFLSALMNGDVAFIALDLPGASRFTLHILAAVAEQEATAISERTRAALAAAKARGQKLGGPMNLTDAARERSLAVRRAHAADRHRLTLPLVRAWTAAGWSLQKQADALTELRVPQPRATRVGQAPKPWRATQVRRLVILATHHETSPV